MATLRAWLDKNEFDWNTGTIVYQQVNKDSMSDGWGEVESAELINKKHHVLDKQFDDGYGLPNCPKIIAKDDKAIYFPGQYYGCTWLEKVMLDINYYLDIKNTTPYPGGS